MLRPTSVPPIDEMFNTAYCKKQTENSPYGKIPPKGLIPFPTLKIFIPIVDDQLTRRGFLRVPSCGIISEVMIC
jgi:hypothetical protein